MGGRRFIQRCSSGCINLMNLMEFQSLGRILRPPHSRKGEDMPETRFLQLVMRYMYMYVCTIQRYLCRVEQEMEGSELIEEIHDAPEI